MYKVIILLRRADTMTHDEFAQWWLVEHAPMARQLPNVRRICFNLCDADSPYDGVSELWFDSREHFDAAYASDIGKAVAADSMSHVSARERLPVDEHWQLND